jgi:Rps23 Pro-64 3,4-dihydroxylase Tpa1-like proline 4-hydroxylase
MPSVVPSALPDPRPLAARFRGAAPFRHLVIDGFFPAEFADALLRDFPAFERGNARNEQGELGGKSTVERIRELGDTYAALDDLVKSKAFLDWLSTATGIPDLLYDPHYFGGGTHDNRHGQELDAHVDFNRHPATGWHRRLNLIVYLNPEWDDRWGGALELHSDPRSADDAVTLITPRFNRCVVFETTEWSWHGFSRIALPADRQALSRRSVALYFYTRERPADELAPEHSTIYVDRPLPDHFVPGRTLSEQDVQELKVLLARRDQHNQRLYNELIAAQNQANPGGTSGNQGHLQRLGYAFDSLLGGRHRFSAEGLKAAFKPFVSQLPSGLREPLRRAWRRLARRPPRP